MSVTAFGPARRLGYVPALDGIRGIAILGVLSNHALGFQGGAIGVDLFFVLSGFLITTLLMQEWRENGSVSFLAFYARRALRLLPALGVYIFVVMLLTVGAAATGALDGHHLRVALQGLVCALFYVSNIAKASGLDLGPFTHMWSLAEEEQFYLLWPLVLVVCLRRSVSPTTLLKMLLGLAGALAVYRVGAAALGGSNEWLISGPDMRTDPIIVGCAAGVAYTCGLLPRRAFRSDSRRRALAASAVLAAVVTAWSADRWPLWGHAAGLPLFEIAAAVLIVGVVLDHRSVCTRALSFRPLVSTGKISYSLYIWQGLFLASAPNSLPAAAGAVALSVVVAALSRRLVEQPFLERKRRSRSQTAEAMPALATAAA